MFLANFNEFQVILTHSRDRVYKLQVYILGLTYIKYLFL